jgi:hypothetical protein
VSPVTVSLVSQGMGTVEASLSWAYPILLWEKRGQGSWSYGPLWEALGLEGQMWLTGQWDFCFTRLGCFLPALAPGHTAPLFFLDLLQDCYQGVLGVIGEPQTAGLSGISQSS